MFLLVHHRQESRVSGDLRNRSNGTDVTRVNWSRKVKCDPVAVERILDESRIDPHEEDSCRVALPTRIIACLCWSFFFITRKVRYERKITGPSVAPRIAEMPISVDRNDNSSLSCRSQPVSYTMTHSHIYTALVTIIV